MTRVMFSRGNVSEKIRFGKLVQPSDHVLDMYAGIGYFSLPALVCGNCQSLVACEWNEDALTALRFNLAQNHVKDRAVVFAGDCRKSIKEQAMYGKYNRVSLVLLPSSEGGWSTAVKALRPETGGWLHIHGNVPTCEIEKWSCWLSWKILGIVQQEGRITWGVSCNHVEKVKSFAPTIAHLVADVWVGPVNGGDQSPLTAHVSCNGKQEQFLRLSDSVEVPTCALSDDGPLNQKWMR